MSQHLTNLPTKVICDLAPSDPDQIHPWIFPFRQLASEAKSGLENFHGHIFGFFTGPKSGKRIAQDIVQILKRILSIRPGHASRVLPFQQSELL